MGGLPIEKSLLDRDGEMVDTRSMNTYHRTILPLIVYASTLAIYAYDASLLWH